MNMKLLKDILTGYGATGHEGHVRAVIEGVLCGHVDSMETDALGNLIATRKGTGEGKRIMIAAHMDHIGLGVLDADENGFLRVCAVGGIYAKEMPGIHIVSESGVCGVVGADEEVKGEIGMNNLYVDIGAETREEALSRVSLGEVLVMQPHVSMLGQHRMASPAMDDRIACYILAEAMLSLPENCKNEVVAVFSTQEEVGLRGATVAAYRVNPDMGIAIDVTGTGDVPKCGTKMAVKLGGGAAIKIMDRSMIAAPSVVSLMEETAKENGIGVQREVLPYGGTDAGAIQKTRCGVPTGAISIPCRYIHSAAETVDLRDVEAALKLLQAVILK